MPRKKSSKKRKKPVPKEKPLPAQVQAVIDIQEGRVPHDKWNCPGCPIH